MICGRQDNTRRGRAAIDKDELLPGSCCRRIPEGGPKYTTFGGGGRAHLEQPVQVCLVLVEGLDLILEVALQVQPLPLAPVLRHLAVLPPGPAALGSHVVLGEHDRRPLGGLGRRRRRPTVGEKRPTHRSVEHRSQ